MVFRVIVQAGLECGPPARRTSSARPNRAHCEGENPANCLKSRNHALKWKTLNRQSFPFATYGSKTSFVFANFGRKGHQDRECLQKRVIGNGHSHAYVTGGRLTKTLARHDGNVMFIEQSMGESLTA